MHQVCKLVKYKCLLSSFSIRLEWIELYEQAWFGIVLTLYQPLVASNLSSCPGSWQVEPCKYNWNLIDDKNHIVARYRDLSKAKMSNCGGNFSSGTTFLALMDAVNYLFEHLWTPSSCEPRHDLSTFRPHILCWPSQCQAKEEEVTKKKRLSCLKISGHRIFPSAIPLAEKNKNIWIPLISQAWTYCWTNEVVSDKSSWKRKIFWRHLYLQCSSKLRISNAISGRGQGGEQIWTSVEKMRLPSLQSPSVPV